MGIMEEDIAKVRAATDFVGLASEKIFLKRVGTRWVGLCPFHSEKSPSFSINAEQGLYYCFGCQASGDVITFVRELDGLDFVEALELLAGRSGITLRTDDGNAGRDSQRRRKVYDAVAAAMAFYHDRLCKADDARAARAYLRAERGYDTDIVARYQLGWAPDEWHHLGRATGIPRDTLVDAGLVKVNDQGRDGDFFRGRILFPIFEPAGRPIGAGGRMLPGGRPPKYMNTVPTVVYDKSRTLYGLNWAKEAIVRTGQVVVCEGYTDVIGLHLAGVGEAVATCGTSLADGHIKTLTRFAKRIVLAYDADAAGQHAGEQYHDWEQRHEVDIRVARLPEGSDPGDLSRTDPGALRQAVADARPYLAYRLERLYDRYDMTTAEGRARAAVAAVSLVDTHPSDLVRDQYLMDVADRTRITPDRLRSLPAQPVPVVEPPPSRRQPERPAPSAAEEVAVELPLAEREALLLALHRPEEVAARLEPCLFDHAVARAAFAALLSADTLHDAVDEAHPQVAAVLRRLAVEDTVSDTDSVMAGLVERAANRAHRDLLAEARQARDPRDWAPTLSWLQLTRERLRDPDDGRAAEDLLVRWLVARSEGDPTEGRGEQ